MTRGIRNPYPWKTFELPPKFSRRCIQGPSPMAVVSDNRAPGRPKPSSFLAFGTAYRETEGAGGARGLSVYRKHVWLLRPVTPGDTCRKWSGGPTLPSPRRWAPRAPRHPTRSAFPRTAARLATGFLSFPVAHARYHVRPPRPSEEPNCRRLYVGVCYDILLWSQVL